MSKKPILVVAGEPYSIFPKFFLNPLKNLTHKDL